MEKAANLTYEDKLEMLKNAVTQAKMDFEDQTKILLRKKHAAKQEGMNCSVRVNRTTEYMIAQVNEETQQRILDKAYEAVYDLKFEKDEMEKRKARMEAELKK